MGFTLSSLDNWIILYINKLGQPWGKYANRCIMADIESIIYCTLGKQYNLFTTKEYESMNYWTRNRHANRYTTNEIYSTIYRTPNRQTNRFTTEEIYLTTFRTELEASTLTCTKQNTNTFVCRFYNCRVFLKLVWQSTVSYDFCVLDVLCRENN